MLKTIIATCLLTFSCSSGSLKVEHPNNLVNQNEINGNYCFQQTFDFTNLSRAFDDYIVFDDTFDYYVPFYFGDESGTSYLQKIYVDIDTQYAFIDLYYYVEGTNTVSHFSFSLTDNDDLDDLSINNKYLHFFVSQRLTLSDIEVEVLNTLFSHEANNYVTYYSGYYTYVRTNELTSYFGATGSFIFNNAMYFNMNRYSSDTAQNYLRFQCNIDLSNVNETRLRFTTQITPMPTNVISQIYMTNVMMSNRSKTILEQYGVFEYVADVNTSTWYEMILSVMDAPIYYLKNLLGFELFGINLFLALGSLLTLVLIVVLIKKVI